MPRDCERPRPVHARARFRTGFSRLLWPVHQFAFVRMTPLVAGTRIAQRLDEIVAECGQQRETDRTCPGSTYKDKTS